MMRFSFLAIALLLLTACAQNSAGISIDSSNQNVVLSDSALADQLELGKAVTTKMNGRLLANVTLTNKTNETQYLQFRFYWYDELGLELNVDQSPWREFVLYGGDSKTVQGVAVSLEAENFRVSIRRSQ